MSVEPALVDPALVEADPVEPMPVVSVAVGAVVPVPPTCPAAVGVVLRAVDPVPVVPTLNFPPSAWNSCQPAHAMTRPPTTPMSRKIEFIG
jgi:hypothetical protein